MASQDREAKLFTTTFTLSGFKPMMMGGTERKKRKGEAEDDDSALIISFDLCVSFFHHIYRTLTMNIKVKRLFCTSSHIVSHTHISSCIRYLSRQNLTDGERKGGGGYLFLISPQTH